MLYKYNIICINSCCCFRCSSVVVVIKITIIMASLIQFSVGI